MLSYVYTLFKFAGEYLKKKFLHWKPFGEENPNNELFKSKLWELFCKSKQMQV